MAKVSVIIPVWNGARTVTRALASVFAQSYTDYEVVVVDDGSTDATPELLAGYGDRIRVVTQSNRGLPGAARNAGVRESRGQYLAFLDDDDGWTPLHLARCVALLDEDPGCVLAYSRWLRVDEQGRPIGRPEGDAPEVESPTMAQMLERPWDVATGGVVVRSTAFKCAGGFSEVLRAAEDKHFWLLAREQGHFRCVPQPLVRISKGPLYPKALEREPDCDLFVALVRERYGSSANGLIREFRRARVKALRHVGRLLMKEGRLRDARRCLARVIHYQPMSANAYRRYLQTFLPTRAPRVSSSSNLPGV